MAHYVVNLGKSRIFVEQNKYFWAPKGSNAGWKNMPKVQVGDVIFCNHNRRIFALALVKTAAYEFDKPKDKAFDDWSLEGYRVDVELTLLAFPFDINEVREDFLSLHNRNCSPKLFASNGHPSQNYLVRIPDASAPLFYKALGDEKTDAFFESLEELAESNVSKADNPQRGSVVSRSRSKPKSGVVFKERISKARIGQGWFRDELLKIWDGSCALTGVRTREALIASHIVSWYLSNLDEKLDPENGLPLVATVDRLFDKGLISFSDEGDLLLSAIIPVEEYQRMFLRQGMKLQLPLTEGNKKYLKRHRENFGF